MATTEVTTYGWSLAEIGILRIKWRIWRQLWP